MRNIAIISTDWHIDAGNVELSKNLAAQQILLAKKKGVKLLWETSLTVGRHSLNWFSIASRKSWTKCRMREWNYGPLLVTMTKLTPILGLHF